MDEFENGGLVIDTSPNRADVGKTGTGDQGARGFPRIYVFLAAFWAGLFVMTVEMIGGRTLAPYFGSGVYVWGSVIFVFMLSLSIGYLLGGQMSRRNATTIRLAQIMIGAGVATVPGMVFSGMILDYLEQSSMDPRYAAVIGATSLFLLPTTLWGIISPYAVRLLVSRAEDSGESAGFLYFVSTAGSSIGTLATSFYLVLWFDTTTILIGVVVGSILVGLIGFGARPRPASLARENHLRSDDAEYKGNH